MKISHESRKLSREFIICSSQWPFSGVQFSDLHLGYHKVTWVIPWPSVLLQEETNLEGSQVHRNGWTGVVTVSGCSVFGTFFGESLVNYDFRWIKLSWKMMEHHSDECVSNLFLLQEWIPGPGNDHISCDPRPKLLSRWFFEAFSLLVGYLSSFPGGK